MSFWSTVVLMMVVCAGLATCQSYGAPQPQYALPPQPKQLIDNFVCSIEGNYGLYGQRRPHFRPQPNFCINAGIKEDSCQRCCRMAAQIENSNVTEEQIFGFIAIVQKSSLCVCCAPRSVVATTTATVGSANIY